MIDDPYYMTAFFMAITVISVIGSLPLLRHRELDKFPEANLLVGTLLMLVIVIIFIGLRNPYGSWRYFGDTFRYTDIFHKIQSDPTWVYNKDYGFFYYMKFLSNFVNIQTFFFVTAVLYVVPVYITLHKWFKNYAFFAVILYVTSLSFWPFGINGMRNGLATSFFIFALGFYDRKWLMYSFIGLSISFHTTILLPTLAFILVHFYNNTKVFLYIWLASIPISFLFGRQLLGIMNFLLTSTVGLVDERGDYGDVDSSILSSSSFRIDFVIYSAIVIYLGYYFIYKIGFKNAFYNKLLNLYIIANTIWLYFIYFPYTNRVAYLSWFLIPPLVVYPIVYSSRLKNQSYFMAGSVTVSLLFAWLISYL